MHRLASLGVRQRGEDHISRPTIRDPLLTCLGKDLAPHSPRPASAPCRSPRSIPGLRRLGVCPSEEEAQLNYQGTFGPALEGG